MSDTDTIVLTKAQREALVAVDDGMALLAETDDLIVLENQGLIELAGDICWRLTAEGEFIRKVLS